MRRRGRGGRDRFAACVAHELRAPVALQRALVEVALADPRADTATLRAMGERVIAGCERQQRLIDALLLLTRSQSALTRREPVDIAVITADALRAHDLSRFESVVTLEPARTTGDPDLLERIAANLISNAMRHNVSGGRIDITTHSRSRHAVLSVANSGPPIPAERLAHLFQPFQRLDSQPRTGADGVGLGLAIVQAIAHAHHATTTAHSRPGGGLTIEVNFPARLAADVDNSSAPLADR